MHHRITVAVVPTIVWIILKTVLWIMLPDCLLKVCYHFNHNCPQHKQRIHSNLFYYSSFPSHSKCFNIIQFVSSFSAIWTLCHYGLYPSLAPISRTWSKPTCLMKSGWQKLLVTGRCTNLSMKKAGTMRSPSCKFMWFHIITRSNLDVEIGLKILTE